MSTDQTTSPVGYLLAPWHEEPPPDPVLVRRILRLRWERGLSLLVVPALFLISLLISHFNVFVFTGAYIGFLRWAWTRRALPSVAHLMDLPATFDQYPVEVMFRTNGALYGTDTGILSVSGAWLTFQGLRSTFAVRPCDVVIKPQWNVKDDKSGPNSKISLNLNYCVESLPFDLTIVSLSRIDNVEGDFRPAFMKGLRQWITKQEFEAGCPTFPPASAHTSALRRFRQVSTAISLVLAAAIAASVYAAFHPLLLFEAPYVTLGLCLFAAVAGSIALFKTRKDMQILQDLDSHSDRSSRKPTDGGEVPSRPNEWDEGTQSDVSSLRETR